MNAHTADTDGIHGIQADFTPLLVLDVKGILTQERKIIKREVMMNGSTNGNVHDAHQYDNWPARWRYRKVNNTAISDGIAVEYFSYSHESRG